MSADHIAAGLASPTAILRSLGIDASTYGYHKVLGRMIYDEQSVDCSHCWSPDAGGLSRVRLNRHDRFWFQYCRDCGADLDAALTRLVNRRRRSK